MTIDLSPELEQMIKEQVETGAYESAEQLVEQAIQDFISSDNQNEFDVIDVTEAIAQFKRGECMPAAQALAAMRAKHGI